MWTLIIKEGPSWDQLVRSLYYSMHKSGVTHHSFTVRFVDDKGLTVPSSFTYQTFRVLGIISLDPTRSLILIQETGEGAACMMSRPFDDQHPPRTFAGIYNHSPAFGGRDQNLPMQCLKEVAVTGAEEARERLAKILDILG